MTEPRQARAQDAIHRAFFTLVLQKRYHEIKIEDVLQASGVARSTFYLHFANKHALLASSLRGPFSLLAACVRDSINLQQLEGLLQHFWQNRALARGIFTGSVRTKVSAVLAAMLETEMRALKRAYSLPLPLASAAIAELQLSLISDWLLGRASCDPSALAAALHRSSHSVFQL